MVAKSKILMKYRKWHNLVITKGSQLKPYSYSGKKRLLQFYSKGKYPGQIPLPHSIVLKRKRSVNPVSAVICKIVPLISCVIVHCHPLHPFSLYIILFHSLSGSQLKGPRIPIILAWSNFMWLYLDTFHFLCKGRRPASHNPMMQPSIDLPPEDVQLCRMPRQRSRGSSIFLECFSCVWTDSLY